MNDTSTLMFEAELKEHQERERRSKLFEPVLKAKTELNAQKQIMKAKHDEIDKLREEVRALCKQLTESDDKIDALWADYSKRWLTWTSITIDEAPKPARGRLNTLRMRSSALPELRNDSAWQITQHKLLAQLFEKGGFESKPKDHIQTLTNLAAIFHKAASFLEERVTIIQQESDLIGSLTVDFLLIKRVEYYDTIKYSYKSETEVENLQSRFETAMQRWKLDLPNPDEASSLLHQKRVSEPETDTRPLKRH